MSQQWIEVFAGLKNPAMREVLGAVLCHRGDELAADRNTEKNLQRWQKIGLLQRGERGWQINDQMLAEALRAQSRPASERAGVERYFNGPKLHTLPAREGDRLTVLEYIRDAVMDPGEELSEQRLNERLMVIYPDVALLRRYMVDHGLLLRAADGTGYRLPSP